MVNPHFKTQKVAIFSVQCIAKAIKFLTKMYCRGWSITVPTADWVSSLRQVC